MKHRGHCWFSMKSLTHGVQFTTFHPDEAITLKYFNNFLCMLGLTCGIACNIIIIKWLNLRPIISNTCNYGYVATSSTIAFLFGGLYAVTHSLKYCFVACITCPFIAIFNCFIPLVHTRG